MKKISVLFFLFVFISNISAEVKNDNSQINPFSFEISYWRPLIFGGFTQVREWEHIGERYDLNEELGLNRIDGIDFTFRFPLGEKHKINLQLGRYFFQGHQLLTESGFYNGTKYQSNSMAWVDASRYIKVMLLDYMTLSKSNEDMLQLIFGVSFDAIRFLIDAPFTEDSPRKETFEQFDKQIVPVPIIGICWNKYLRNETIFHAEARGGTWPGIDTWYEENGTIKIWQYNLEADIGVTKMFGDIETQLNFNFRLISIKGESDEDTNEILIHGFGPTLKIAYNF